MSKPKLLTSPPDEWPRKRLDEVCSVVSRGKQPSYVEQSPVRAINQKCVRPNGFQVDPTRYQDPGELDKHLTALPGDVLLNSTGRGTIGRSCVLREDGEFIVDSHVTLLRPVEEVLDPSYLDALLRSWMGQNYLETHCYSGSTSQVELSKTALVKSEIPVPPFAEQRRIADVLDTVDRAIQETDSVVEKQEQVKTGLLQDLLTRGLDANGRLRDPEREPEAFRETEYGPLPETWEMKPLNDFAANGSDTFGNGPFGSNLLTSEMTHEGVPVVYIADIEEGRYRRETDRHVTPEKAQELSGFDVRKGDVIMSKVGDPPCDAAPYLRDQFAIMTQDVIRIRPAEDVDTQFLTDLLNSKVGRKAVGGIAVQGTRKRVSLTDLKAVRLPKPPHEEQLRIGKVVATKRQKMEEERSYRDKLRHLKRGLMQDLLTGRVRVPEAEARVDEVVA